MSLTPDFAVLLRAFAISLRSGRSVVTMGLHNEFTSKSPLKNRLCEFEEVEIDRN